MKTQTEEKWSFVFSILLRKEEDLWIAHCLELDLVAAAPNREEAESDILSIIDEQVRYCITNNNMENLFRDAPKEVWDEFRACRRKSKPRQMKFAPTLDQTPPVSFVTNNCLSYRTEASEFGDRSSEIEVGSWGR